MTGLQSELTTLRREILSMGATVEDRVRKACDALFAKDLELARVVRTGDAEVDEMEVRIEAECLQILALNQPVASDLRFVLAVMRINNDLERIGDMAEGMAERVIAMSESRPPLPSALRLMADATRTMLAGSLSALADEDAAQCHRVRRDDDRVDDLQREIFAWVQAQIQERVETAHVTIDILSISRKLERIADLATNIAEDVVFLVDGSVIRHTAET